MSHGSLPPYLPRWPHPFQKLCGGGVEGQGHQELRVWRGTGELSPCFLLLLTNLPFLCLDFDLSEGTVGFTNPASSPSLPFPDTFPPFPPLLASSLPTAISPSLPVLPPTFSGLIPFLSAPPMSPCLLLPFPQPWGHKRMIKAVPFLEGPPPASGLPKPLVQGEICSHPEENQKGCSWPSFPCPRWVLLTQVELGDSDLDLEAWSSLENPRGEGVA